MYMSRAMGLFAIIPATGLLTISFFVLFALHRTEQRGLKTFGYVITVLLWCSALLVSSIGLYTIFTGRCMIKKMMHYKMRGMMECPQMSEKMPMQK